MNLNDIPDGPAGINPGKYIAKLTDVIEEESQSSGQPTLVWYWEIVSSADGDRSFEGKEIKSWTSLQEQALFGLKNHLEAFGESGDVDVETDKYIGKKAVLVVGKNKYKSKRTGEDVEGSKIVEVQPLPSSKTSSAGKGPVTSKGTKGVKDVPF